MTKNVTGFCSVEEDTRIEGGDDDGDVDMAENISVASLSDGEFEEMGGPSNKDKK